MAETVTVRPCRPPRSLSARKKAWAPKLGPAKASAPTGLVSEARMPTWIVVAVTPTSVAWFWVPGAVVAEPGDGANALAGSRVPQPVVIRAAAQSSAAVPGRADHMRRQLQPGREGPPARASSPHSDESDTFQVPFCNTALPVAFGSTTVPDRDSA